MPDPIDQAERLNRLEQGIGDLGASLATITADVRQLVDVQRGQAAQITELQRLDRDRRNTPWPTLISIAGLMVVIGGLALSPVVTQVGGISAELENHKHQEGHPHMVERVQHAMSRIDANAEGIQQMDDVLQREMRLLDDVLQREMRLLADQQGVDLEWIRARITDLTDKADRANQSGAATAAHIERLQQQIDRMEGQQ